MSKYLEDSLAPPTQREPLTPEQVPNSAGGYSWDVGDWMRLERFLILGSEGGSYYASERDLTRENVDAVKRCLTADWHRAVNMASAISVTGRAPKNDPAILVLALAATHDLTVRVDSGYPRSAILETAVNDVCRTGTHILRFVSFVDGLRGWGAALRRIVSSWYLGKSPNDLAYQLLKYRNRYGWTHHDVMHVAHPAFTDKQHKAIAKWAKDGRVRKSSPDILVHAAAAVESWEKDHDANYLAALILDAGLPREALPTDALREPVVWEGLLDAGMPRTALIRNLATMTRIGLLTQGSTWTRTVANLITDQKALTRARVHPIQVLAALTTYKMGRGMRGQHTWTPVTKITDALDEAFYLAFGSLDVSDKRVLLALDVSGSMGWGDIAGIPGLTPRVGSAAMAMVALHQFPNADVVAFSRTMVPVDLSKRRRLDDVVSDLSRIPMGGTDCSLPMRDAQRRRSYYDAFHVYTDSETWAGEIHAAAALAEYRRSGFGPTDAKLVVVGMVSNGFTIADPKDPGMLDVVGFDTAAPNVIADFTTR